MKSVDATYFVRDVMDFNPYSTCITVLHSYYKDSGR